MDDKTMQRKKLTSNQTVSATAHVQNSTGDLECATCTVEQAGRRLGISRGLAYALARTGELPTIRLGHRVLVPKHALERLIGT
jgi:excisionase family DNA binding protein